MKRILSSSISKDLKKKLVLLSGPRQVGKTTLSKQLVTHFQYLNFDESEHRKIIKEKLWDRSTQLIIFDELHKKLKWKSWIKGVYDTEKIPPELIITGSARMDVFKRGGDSLAGRHFSYRLHPFTLKELKGQFDADEGLKRLMNVGGFPEPFLEGSEEFAKRWRKTHIDKILKEDLLELEQVRQIKSMEILVDLLSERVGSSVSFSSLARDLEVSPNTVKHWIQILESLYVIFVVPPYSKNIARAILREPKIYFYDVGRVKNDPAMRFENLVACSILKELHFGEDTRGEKNHLYYIRDKQKREVDFLVMRDKKIESLVEVKLSDDSFAKSLLHFTNEIGVNKAYQVVLNLKNKKSTGVARMISGKDFLLDEI